MDRKHFFTALCLALLSAQGAAFAQGISWAAPTNVSMDDIATDRTPALTVGRDSSGAAWIHVVYQNLDERELYHAYRPLMGSTTWQVEQATDRNRPDWPDCSSWEPAVGLDSAGVLNLAYQAKFSGADPEIMWTDNSGGSFRPPSYVTSDMWDDSEPDVVCWGDSTWVVYAGQGGNTPDTDQEIWLWDTQITDNSAEEAAPRAAVDSAGHLHLVFAGNGSGGNIGIYYATNASGSWDTTRIVGPDAFNANPDIALDSTGHAHVVWERSVEGTQFDIFYATNSSGVFDTTRLTRTESDEHSPAIAVDPEGFCHVVYQGSAGDPPEEVIFYTNNRSGVFTSLSAEPQRLSPDSLADARYPDIAIGPAGHLHVVFQASNGRSTDIYYTTSVETVPVVLEVASARRVENGVRLTWTTASEENVAAFAVERYEKSTWEQVGLVPASGTSAEEHTYSFVDTRAPTGEPRYRLVEISTDGNRTVLVELQTTADLPLRFTLSRAYPNPFNPSTSFTFVLPVSGSVRFEVFDARGRRVYTENLARLEKGEHRYRWKANVPSGVYFARFVLLTGDQQVGTRVQKLVVLR